jgi:hypothetical protein
VLSHGPDLGLENVLLLWASHSGHLCKISKINENCDDGLGDNGDMRTKPGFYCFIGVSSRNGIKSSPLEAGLANMHTSKMPFRTELVVHIPCAKDCRIW